MSSTAFFFHTLTSAERTPQSKRGDLSSPNMSISRRQVARVLNDSFATLIRVFTTSNIMDRSPFTVFLATVLGTLIVPLRLDIVSVAQR